MSVCLDCVLDSFGLLSSLSESLIGSYGDPNLVALFLAFGFLQESFFVWLQFVGGRWEGLPLLFFSVLPAHDALNLGFEVGVYGFQVFALLLG